MQGRIIERPRNNQPRGYVAEHFNHIKPVIHYCVHHNYCYYPFSWTDEATGETYKKGYYDENGQYYENVVFRTDGMYKNVICQCEYCDTITKIDWTEGGPLICPQCGGTLKILSALDEYTQDPQYEKLRQRSDYVDYADLNRDRSDSAGYEEGSVGNVTGKAVAIFFGLMLLLALIIGVTSVSRSNTTPSQHFEELVYERWDSVNNRWVRVDRYGNVIATYGSGNQGGSSGNQSGQTALTNPEIFGELIYLKDTGPGVCVISSDEDFDRTLVWSEDDESYYDDDSELWAWYNTDVEPPLWQYWYEPISADYGDCGWMEYDEADGWYIEVDAGSWFPVPEEYDLSPLWHIEVAPAPVEEDETPEELGHQSDTDEDLNDLALFGTEIHLTERVPGVWRITADGDKTLRWNDGEQSYYDADTGLWLWYNTDVEPPLWQYWYEPISGDYGDCGWMEYEAEEWYIETDAGIWEPVPEKYDTGALWHIESDED